MDFITISCPYCGRELKVPENAEKIVCMFCAKPIDVTKLRQGKNAKLSDGIDAINNLLPKELFSFQLNAKNFNAANYPKQYENYSKKFRLAIEAFQSLARTEPSATEQFAELLFRGFAKEIEGQKNVPFDCRLTITALTVPSLLSLGGSEGEQAADCFLKKWNKHFPKEPLGKAKYDDILGGFRKRLCYITTAVCESIGDKDGGKVLDEFRRFRDRWLIKAPNGNAKITEYYLFAPMIVRAIDTSGCAKKEYMRIWEQYLAPCLKNIHSGQLDVCAANYQAMVRSLEQKWLFSNKY